MPGIKEILKEAAKAALVAGAATGAAHAFPGVLAAVEKLGATFGRASLSKIVNKIPRERALELIKLIGEAFSRGTARGSGLDAT